MTIWEKVKEVQKVLNDYPYLSIMEAVKLVNDMDRDIKAMRSGK